MKYILFLLASLLLVACSSGGSSPEIKELRSWMQRDGKIKALSTTAMIDDLVREIGGERVASLVLIRGDLDPHSYELVKGDDEKLSFAQVVFYNGLGLEHGASLEHRLEVHPHAVPVAQSIERNCPERIVRKGNQIDPHVWMDISLWVQIIPSIVEGLTEVDPEGHAYFVERAQVLESTMREAHEALRARLQAIPTSLRYLVTSHDAFNYFAFTYLAEEGEEHWSERFQSPEGISPDGQLSAADIQRIIEQLCRHDIRTIFPESNISRDSLKKIVEVCHSKEREVAICSEALYTDCMGPRGSDADSYLKMMAHNAEVLERGLQR